MSQLRTGHLAALALAALALALSVGLALGAPADLDTSFDGDGRRTIGYGGADSGQAVALQPDGKILVAGYGGSSTAMTVTRLNPDGSTDNELRRRRDAPASNYERVGPHFASALAVQPDGNLVIVGETRHAAEAANVAVARLNPDGSPDLGFGGDGTRVIDLFGDDRGQAVALQPDGKILVAGFGGAFGNAMTVTRLNPDGSTDMSSATGHGAVTWAGSSGPSGWRCSGTARSWWSVTGSRRAAAHGTSSSPVSWPAARPT